MNHIIVTQRCKEIRRNGWISLSGNWAKGALTTLLFLVAILIPSTILEILLGGELGENFSLVYFLIVKGPLSYGLSYFYLKLCRKEEVSPTDIFKGFENFGKTLVLGLLISIFIFLWSLLLFIPGIIAGLRYSQAFFILVDNPEMSATQALNESKKLMRGNVGKLFLLQLSFIGWMILICISLGILSLWVIPYLYTSYVVFYTILISNKNLDSREDEDGEETIILDNEDKTVDDSREDTLEDEIYPIYVQPEENEAFEGNNQKNINPKID